MNGQARELARRVEKGRRRPNATLTLSLVSGKGGVGKSAIATLLALEFARLRRRTLLVDGDVPFGGAHLLLGAPPVAGLDEALSGALPLERAVTSTEAGPDLLPARLGRPEGGDRFAANRLASGVAQLADGYDVMVVDAPSGEAGAAASLALRTRLAVLVTTPEPASIAAAGVMAKILAARGAAGMGVIVNRALDGVEGRRTAAAFRTLVERSVGRAPELIGCVEEDSELSGAVRSLTLVRDREGAGPAFRAVRAMARKLLCYSAPNVDGQGLINRLNEAKEPCGPWQQS